MIDEPSGRDRVRIRLIALFECLVLLVLHGVAVAQGSGCDGARITTIDIVPGRPPFSGAARKWQIAAHAVGLHHATTRGDVLRAFLELHAGSVCTEQARAESERVLRALPFIADATVRAVPTGGGEVRIEVTTVDEVPVLVSGGIQHGSPATLALGNEDLGGEGVRLFAGMERGFAYRNGGFVELSKYAVFGAPLVAAVSAEQGRIDRSAQLSLALPFLSNIQRGSWQAAFRLADQFPTVSRAGDNDLALEVRSARWSASGTARSHVGSTVTLAGAALIGVRTRPAAVADFVTDSGLVPVADTLVVQRYGRLSSVRVGALGAARRISYRRVTGYDALFGAQDLLTGAQLGVLAAPGTMASHTDLLGGATFYAGHAGARWFGGAEVESEARRDFALHDWSSLITSGRAAMYGKPGEAWLVKLESEYSSVARSLVPAVLSISEPAAGVRGFAGARLAGTEREVGRAEVRWAQRNVFGRGDVGLAVFTDAGALHGGDVPYGQTTTVQSAGISVLAAFPSRSRRIYRLDVAVPVRRGAARGAGIEFRFSSDNPTAQFWREPADVAAARLAPVPSTLFSWPLANPNQL